MAAGAALTPEQERAIAHPAPRLQVLACAGSGKTEVLARRAVRLLLEGTDPASVVAFTFTEKAAAELKARIELRAAEADPAFAALPPGGRGMFIGTTHSWALQSLRELGLYETVDALSEEQEWALLLRVARRLGVVDLYAGLKERRSDQVATARAIGVFLRSAEVVHNERLDRDRLRAAAGGFASVLERYEWLLHEMRVLPFRLMIARAADELAPGGRLRERLAGRVAHVLVDEFQDFNRAQDELVQRLAELGATVTAVGDDDQAIYQWRGGDVSLFVTFVQRHGGEQVQLDLNHRCRPEIVRFARRVVEALPSSERLDKVLDSARQAAPGGAVEVAQCPSAEDEAGWIATRIAELLAQGHRPGDVAVLYRSVRTSAGPLVSALRERGIPVSVVGKTSLLARPEMALVARIIVLWAGGGESGIWYPDPEFTPQPVTRDALLEEIASVTCTDPRRAQRALAALDRLGARVRRDGVDDSVALFNEVLATLGLPGSHEGAEFRELGLGRMSELLVEFDRAVRRAAPAALYQNLSPAQADEAQEDLALAAAAGPPPPAKSRVLGATRGEIYLLRLKAFLEEFAGRAAEETPDSSPDTRDAVQIMTVHQAKGLEFPVVFVPCLVEGRFPSGLMGRAQHWYVPAELFHRGRYEGREEDEARLLYVALTRARELLVVSWFRRHRTKEAVPSRFLTRHLRPALSEALAGGQASPQPMSRAGAAELLDLDFSRLITYAECGYRYWLRHVCGFQPPLVPELGFGRFLHHLVAELARRAMAGSVPTAADVEALVARDFYLPLAGPVPAENLRRSAVRRVQTYLRRFGHELSRVIRPEARFEVPLEGARVRGRIDLLLRAGAVPERERGAASEGRVELVDFKTSANRPPSDIHRNQLRLYASAAERLGLEPVVLAIHDLDADEGGRVQVPLDDREREGFREQLQRWVEGIRARAFEPVEDRAVCAGCDFRRFCRYAPPSVRTAAELKRRTPREPLLR